MLQSPARNVIAALYSLKEQKSPQIAEAVLDKKNKQVYQIIMETALMHLKVLLPFRVFAETQNVSRIVSWKQKMVRMAYYHRGLIV